MSISHAANAGRFVVQVDADAVKLATWAGSSAGRELPPPRSLVPGLVLVAEWGWAEQSAAGAAYARLRADVDEVSAGALYTYPPSATHITIATLSSFKKVDAARAGLSPAQDARLVEAWGNALERAFSAAPPLGPFELEASRIELSPGAGFLHFSDPTGSIGRLRACVERARDFDPELAALEQDPLFQGRVRCSVHGKCSI